MTGPGEAPGSGPNGHDSRPLSVSSGLAVLAGLVAVLAIAHGPNQVVAVGFVTVGLGGVASGLAARHRGYGLVGAVLAAVGGIVVLVGFVGGLAVTAGVTPKLELLPGLVGLVLLVAGLSSAVPEYERWFVGAGAGAILLAVFVSGLVYDASAAALLTGAAAAIVAWDLGDRAITGGEQVGRQAHTWQTELVHGGSSVLVGAVAVIVALAVYGAGLSDIPLLAVWTLFGAGVVLATALYL